MAGIEQMKKIVPLITCEILYSQYVFELVFGVNLTDLDFWVQIHPDKQPILSNFGFVKHVSLWDFDL